MKIERGVEIPGGGGHGAVPKYPWDQMDVGDCLFMPSVNGEKGRLRLRMMQSAKGFLRKHRKPWRAVSRTVEGGVRVWFVANED